MRVGLLLLPFLIGAMIPFQTAFNNRLGRGLGSYLQAAAISFIVGTTALLIVLPFTTRWPGAAKVAAIPWWAWLGGVLGATFVAAITALRSHLAMSELIILVIAGQIAASLALDHFGLLGSERRPVAPSHLLGVLLVLAGASLVTRGR
ncbi:MAG: DMT family transporter [Phycisphaerales bacterium]|nr:DMT family transporter [Phycisphaerales bacterium]